MTDIGKCEIDVTVGNGQKMKCKLKAPVNINPKVGEMVNLTKFIYVTQGVNNILIVSWLVSKGATMGATQDKMTIKKGVNMILDARKGKKAIMML